MKKIQCNSFKKLNGKPLHEQKRKQTKKHRKKSLTTKILKIETGKISKVKLNIWDKETDNNLLYT